MSQYNKTVLTHAGLELAKRANAGQAKFGITRAVTSADDWSNKTVQDLEEVTTIPNIMQQGIITDTDEVESNNSVISVSLCFTNKKLSTGYQIRIIGLYVKEEGQENDFLYAVTTAVTPEYMPDFNDKVLYRFNMQMYLVIGNAQSVNVVINEGTAVTHGQLDKYKAEVTENLKTLENTHKEDMSHVAKSASINGGAEILPDSTGKLNLVVPDPDLSEYVSLEQLTEILQAKADKTDVNKQIKTVTDLANTKANTVDVDSKIKTVTDLANTKANSADVYTKTEVDSKTSGTIVTAYDVASKNPTAVRDSYTNRSLVDQLALGQFADAINDINGTWNRYTHDDGFDLLTLWGKFGIHYCHNQNMTNVPDWFADKRGTAFVFTFDNNSQTIIYAGCVYDGVAYYNKLEGKWHKLANDNDITNLQNQINANNDRMNDINSNANGRLSLGGGNMHLRSTISWNGGNIDDRTGNLGGLHWYGGTDTASIYGDQNNNDNLDLAFDLGNDGSNHFSFRNSGSEVAAIYSNGHFSGTVDWSNVSGRPDVATHADVNNAIDSIRYAPQERRSLGADDDANNIVDDGVYRISGNPIKNGNDQIWCFLRVKRWDYNTIYQELDCGSEGIFVRNISQLRNNYPSWQKIATSDDISNLQNQIQQLRDNQFEVQTFTDANAAANWEAQKQGKRMAIVNS